MEFGPMQAGSASCPPPQSRSEALASSFKSFMDADQRLFRARENVSNAVNVLEQARMKLADAESYWAKNSETLAGLLMSEAPSQMKAQVMAQQEKMRADIPTRSDGDTLRNPSSRW